MESLLSRRFAINLVVLRGRADLSQEGISNRAGLHTTEISLLERGLRLPRLDTIVKLAGALDVEPCTLFAGMRWRPAESKELPGAYASHLETSEPA